MKYINYIFIFPIKFYQWTLSPLLGKNCRHEPTCSQYTIEAIKIWGPFKGIWLGMKRIAKCHPWGTHGHDPVPERKAQKRIDGTKGNKKAVTFPGNGFHR